MGLFNFRKKKEEKMGDESKYGKAWLLIVGQKQKELGLQMMRELDQNGFIEGTVALSMFINDIEEKKKLLKKAADAGNPEGLWEYCNFLPHSQIPDPNNENDALWEKYCLDAAEKGSVDAMNEMGNVFHRRKNYAESMYWYALANVNDHSNGEVSMEGISKEWVQAGCPTEYVKGSPNFDEDKFKVSLAYLEVYANKEISLDPQSAVDMVSKGVPIAAYFAGGMFESMGNEDMAYNMYSTVAMKVKDPHALKCTADMHYAAKVSDKDITVARKAYLLAATAGERSAMFIMGEFFKDRDKYLAAYWYGVSHTRGYPYSLQRLLQLK